MPVRWSLLLFGIAVLVGRFARILYLEPRPMKIFAPPSRLRFAAVYSAGLLCAVAALPAQVAPSGVAPAPAKEQAIELSPFIISSERETGWSANDTLTATRTKQALKDVPVNIDAITSDFMEDLGLFSADETAKFVANVFALPVMENDNQGGNFSFRGMTQTNNISRNYFRWFIPSDTYNVERIDFGKGSNSLIFGAVEPGGQGAAFTKRPLLKNFGEIFLNQNSEGAYRYQFDYNRKLRSNLALRFNAVRKQGDRDALSVVASSAFLCSTGLAPEKR